MSNPTPSPLDLKPCPFCGNATAPGAYTSDEIEGDGGESFAVVCDVSAGGCGATGPYELEKGEAISEWNRRAGENQPEARDRAWLEQAWNEVQGTMMDTMLNTAQRKAFVFSILNGTLANPPQYSGYTTPKGEEGKDKP